MAKGVFGELVIKSSILQFQIPVPLFELAIKSSNLQFQMVRKPLAALPAIGTVRSLRGALRTTNRNKLSNNRGGGAAAALYLYVHGYTATARPIQDPFLGHFWACNRLQTRMSVLLKSHKLFFCGP